MRIDFPGVGMVTADDDGEGDNISASFHGQGETKMRVNDSWEFGLARFERSAPAEPFSQSHTTISRCLKNGELAL